MPASGEGMTHPLRVLQARDIARKKPPPRRFFPPEIGCGWRRQKSEERERVGQAINGVRNLGVSVYLVLVVLALVLAILSLVKPKWPLLPIAVICITVAMIIARRGF